MQKKSKTILILLSIGALLLMAKKGKAMAKKLTFTKFKNTVANKLLSIQNYLIDLGLNDLQLRLVLAQVLYETGQFTSKSKIAELNNNFSGIKYICKPTIQKNATKGSQVPPNERLTPDTCINYYAKFPSYKDWAIDYIRILSLKRQKNTLGRPIDAENAADFVARLGQNGYFDVKGIKNYTAGVKKYFEMLS